MGWEHASITIGARLNSRFARYPAPKLTDETRKSIAPKTTSFDRAMRERYHGWH